MARQIGSQYRATPQEEGYSIVDRPDPDTIIFHNFTTNEFELWAKRDDFDGFVLEVDGIGYEFIRSGDTPDLV